MDNDIRRTIALYCHLIDDKRFDEWGDLFTDDAVFEARGSRFNGRSEIVASISAMMAQATTKHLIGACVVDLLGDDHARAWTDLATFVPTPNGPIVATIGRYHDELRRGADGRWRFSSRLLVLAGEPGPADALPSPAH
ncbi:MAG: nuclear transport factor 2 family protein [Acidimicrobiales bacterium]|nr:nuclear transport factor 2 family protein [Acidimicrobiales bacterium]